MARRRSKHRSTSRQPATRSQGVAASPRKSPAPRSGRTSGAQPNPRPLRKSVRRNPAWLPPVAVVAAVAVLVGAFFVIRYLTAPAPPPAPTASTTQAILATITSLPASELDQVGLGSADLTRIKSQSGSLLTSTGGQPIVFYYGAEFCPFCAGERWAVIVALSRFGTFSGLQTTTSSSTDTFANTVTFTFRSATFTSAYIQLQTVESSDRNGTALQSPTAAQQSILSKYDTGSTIPFIDIANRYTLLGATSADLPSAISGMSWQAVAGTLAQADSAQAKAILGSANVITAAICRATSNQPSSVCSGAAITSIEARLG
jgi:Domain of unknown function (DUF929)